MDLQKKPEKINICKPTSVLAKPVFVFAYHDKKVKSTSGADPGADPGKGGSLPPPAILVGSKFQREGTKTLHTCM